MVRRKAGFYSAGIRLLARRIPAGRGAPGRAGWSRCRGAGVLATKALHQRLRLAVSWKGIKIRDVRVAPGIQLDDMAIPRYAVLCCVRCRGRGSPAIARSHGTLAAPAYVTRSLFS